MERNLIRGSYAFSKEEYENDGGEFCIKKTVLILALPPTTQTTKLRHLFKSQFPHVYNEGEIIVFAKKKLEVNKEIHENHST